MLVAFLPDRLYTDRAMNCDPSMTAKQKLGWIAWSLLAVALFVLLCYFPGAAN